MSIFFSVEIRPDIFKKFKGQAYPRRKMIRLLEEVEADLAMGQTQRQNGRIRKEYKKNKVRFEDGQARFQDTVRRVEEVLKTLKMTFSGFPPK